MMLYVDILTCMYIYALLIAMDGPYLVDYIQQGFIKDCKKKPWHRQELEDSMVNLWCSLDFKDCV